MTYWLTCLCNTNSAVQPYYKLFAFLLSPARTTLFPGGHSIPLSCTEAVELQWHFKLYNRPSIFHPRNCCRKTPMHTYTCTNTRVYAHACTDKWITLLSISLQLLVLKDTGKDGQNREEEPGTDISYHVPPSHVYTDHRFSG